MGTLQLPTSNETPDKSNDVDAGALFVLKSKGSWVHCGYHLTTSIVAPPLLSLPYAFTFLGWTAGIICLVIGALVTFYSYNLLSLVLEHQAQLGKRQLRFRDMARDILDRSTMGSVFCGANSVCSLLWSCSRMHSFGRTMHEGNLLVVKSKWSNETLPVCHHIWLFHVDFGSNPIISLIEAH